jgi:hypothetical protein
MLVKLTQTGARSRNARWGKGWFLLLGLAVTGQDWRFIAPDPLPFSAAWQGRGSHRDQAL